MRFFDAHNHLQDPRLGLDAGALVAVASSVGVAGMVVNGSCEEDWPAVKALALAFPGFVIPSFGFHPWYIHERSADYLKRLNDHLDSVPSAVGEIGLDRWKPDLAYTGQEDVFLAQLDLAARRGIPASIHCLQTWGRLYDLLRSNPRPGCGFLLHSYGGPAEMIRPLADLGAYFSFPGYFAQDRKLRQRETFRHVPPERLLIETDAPDQLLPENLVRFPLQDPVQRRPVNHPANLPIVAEFLSGWLGQPLEVLASRLEKNFHTLFRPLLGGFAGDK